MSGDLSRVALPHAVAPHVEAPADTFDVKPPQAVAITAVRVVGEPSVGATFDLVVEYEGFVSGPADLLVLLPPHVRPVREAARAVSGAVHLERRVALGAGGARQEATFRLRMTAAGPSMIEVQVRALDAPEPYADYAWRHLQIDAGPTSARVSIPAQEGAFAPPGPGEAREETHDAEISAPRDGAAARGASKTFAVTGQARFWSSDDGAYRGAYGAKVRLYLRRGGQLYPMVSGNSSGVHYDVVGDDGEYQMGFSYDGTLQSTDELVAFVSTATPTVVLRTGVAYTFYGEPYFTESWSVPLYGYRYSSSVNIDRDATLPSGYGAVLRYMTLAQETVDAAYSGQPPVSTSPRYGPNQSDIYVEDLSNACGRYRIWWSWFDYHRQLSIDPSCTQIQTISHEYGHWLHEALVGRDTYLDAERPAVTEGWAVFHSFATRGLANSRYGDDARLFSDNLETAPWDVRSSRRFYNVKYARSGSPEVGAMASFLWSAYDGPGDYDRETASYDVGDNEDVSGTPRYVYDAYRLSGPETRSQVRSAVLARTPSTLDPSVQRAYDFMFGSFTAVPSTPMRAVQASGLSAQKLSNTQLRLSWQTNVYPTSSAYANRPTGYRVYRDGARVATLSGVQSSYTYTSGSGVGGTYRVTAYNAAGESALAPSTSVGVRVSIAGPSLVFVGERSTWSASVSGGSGSTAYRWYRDGTFTGVTTASYSAYPPPSDFTLRVDVTRGGEAASEDLLVSVLGGPGCPNGEIICEYLTALDVPEAFAVHPAAPNPSSGPVGVRYDLPEQARVVVAVYDVLGREVLRPVDGPVQAGFHEATFDAAGLPPGLYVVRVVAGEDAGAQRVTVVR